MKKRYIALLLCLSTLFSTVLCSLPALEITAEEQSLTVTQNGERVDNITIEQDEKETLSAVVKGLEAPSYQWQILLDAEKSLWVNIYDKKDADCEVSYAVVKNMLDGANSTYVRCVAKHDQETLYSNEVCITVLPERQSLSLPQPTNSEQLNEQKAQSSLLSLPQAGEPSADEYVTITVKYLDIASLTSGTDAAIYSPYVATILRGGSFNQSVVSPAFLGFAPYLDSNDDKVIDETDDSAAMLTLSYATVEEDIVIKVYYKPIKVNYAVRYFFQNINDDLYTEDPALYYVGQAETGTIITNETLTAHVGDTTGFTKMYHIPESVAADGSTVFECYFDRNYYLIQFDLDDGYGVEPIYARYNSPFIVNDPIKHGYAFDSWKLIHVDADDDGEWDATLPDGISLELIANIPAHNYYYQAQWVTVDTSYTVAYWLKDSDASDSYKYLGSRIVYEKSGTFVSGPGDDLASASIGGIIDTKYYEYEKCDENVTVEGDGSTVVNVYYTPKKYTLRFYYAATTGTGVDTDSDGIADTFDSVSIVGGSTYYFGHSWGVDTDSDETLLNRVFTYSSIGTVTQLPKLNTEGQSRDYTHGTLVSGSTSYHYIEFTAEYGQNISNLWPCAVFQSAKRTETGTNTNGWTGDEAFVSAWNGEYRIYYSQHNGNETIKGKYEKLDYQLLFDSAYADASTVSYLCFWENGAGGVDWNKPYLFRYNIWVADPSDPTSYIKIDSYDTCDNSTVNEQTQPSLEGYKAVSRKGGDLSLTAEEQLMYMDGYYVDFKYDRELYTFTMQNHGTSMGLGFNTVAYGVQLSTLLSGLIGVFTDDQFTPPYPATLEENAYYFDGWYTTPQHLPGTKVDLSTLTMPAGGLSLYANWVPKSHTVNFFVTYDEMKSYEETSTGDVYYTKDVVHGQQVGVVTTPVRVGEGLLSLYFAGWFYMDAGTKKAFSPLNMPVSRDINVYAEWSSHSPQPYRISYVLKDNPSIAVADDSEGYAYGGTTRTFMAKAGDPYNQLYSKYNTGYFPTVMSHSITIQADDPSDLKNNIYTFFYVYATDISYTIRYVNKETGTVMDTKVGVTSSAVITERFKAFENMVPDAFYKELVLEVVWDEEQGKYVGSENNVITFYYTPNTTSAYYAVHYMFEKLGATEAEKQQYKIDGSGGYEETGTHVEGVGLIGSTIDITPQTILGFEMIANTIVPFVVYNGQADSATNVAYDSVNNTCSLTITKEGTELYLFYERKDFSYHVYYYEYNTTTPVAGTASESGTEPYGSSFTATAKDIAGYTCVSSKTQTITIRDNSTIPDMNVIIFYYAPIQYVVEYVPVPSDGGWLSNTIEVITGDESLSGSIPTANSYHEFVGWYIDAECTIPVTAEHGTIGANNQFTPDKSKLSDITSNTFYAKFNKKVGNLTINRNDAGEADQVFVYKILNDVTGEIITVTVTGNGSTTIYNLPLGSYTVTQQNDWSWRYDDAGVSVDHQNAAGTTVVFSKPEQDDQWLNGNSALIENVRG